MKVIYIYQMKAYPMAWPDLLTKAKSRTKMTELWFQ